MNNTRVARLEESLWEESEQEALKIVLGSICYESNTMYLCVDGGFSGTVDEGEQYMEDNPGNLYVTFGDPSNAHQNSGINNK